MKTERQKKLAEQIQQLAAEYIAKHASRHALITVTGADISADLKNATIYFTVFPEDKENAALAFLKRHGSDFRAFAKKNLNTKTIPFFSFEIDKGEKNFYKIIESLP